MKMVIDIPDEMYDTINRGIYSSTYDGKKIRDIVLNGTPLPKGHWTEHPHEWGDNWQYSQYECSCCHNWAYHDTDYCPNCGAEMESD